jgi:uncharacterized protein
LVCQPADCGATLLHPDWPLSTDVIAAALRDVIEDQCGARRLTHDEEIDKALLPQKVES